MSYRRLLAFLTLPLLLAGCETFHSATNSVGSTLGLTSSEPQRSVDTNVSVAMRTGIAVSDEPLAARAGAAVLNDQGSAADAVTTMFFALTATYPVAAGLGGGGICLVYDPASRATTEFDFLTRAANRGGYYAIPGAVRGFYQMQRQFGALPWQRSVAPGEGLAATGFPVSQALAVRLAAAQNIIRQDPLLAAVFLDTAGQPKAAGAIVGNRSLAQTLSEIRLGGADGFYKGAAAAAIIAYSNAQGGAITYPELAGYTAQQMRARTLNTGTLTVALPGPRTGAGAFAGALIDALARLPASARNSQSASIAAVRQVLARFGVTALPPDLGATGFAAVDASGQAAACAVTLNGPFGTARTATGSGVVLAASPAGQGGISAAFLTPIIAMNTNGAAVVGAGAGGPYGSAAIIDALLKVAAGRPVERPRDLGPVTGAASYDTVNAITCQGVCVALPDPGGHGVGAASFAAQQPQ